MFKIMGFGTVRTPRSRLNLARHFWPHAAVAMLGLCAFTAALGGTTNVTLESTHRNQLSGFPLVFEDFQVSGNAVQDGSIQARSSVSQSHTSTFQDSQFEGSAGFLGGFGQPILLAHHAEKVHLWGVGQTQRRWLSSFTEINSFAGVSDVLTWTPAVTTPESWEFVFRLTASFTQKLDISPGQSPLYRLSNQFNFFATANNSVADIDVVSSTYDPHAGGDPPRYEWSVLVEDVNRANEPVPDLNERIQVLRVNTDRDPITGSLKPIGLQMGIELQTFYNFLNDGSELNYALTGEMSYDFNNSAELLGVIVRDANGIIITDLEIHSEAGFSYQILGVVPEPATWLMLLVGAAFMPLAQRNRCTARVGQRLAKFHEIPYKSNS